MAKSKSLRRIRSGRGGRRKQFDKNGGTNSRWLRTRRRVRRKLLGG